MDGKFKAGDEVAFIRNSLLHFGSVREQKALDYSGRKAYVFYTVDGKDVNGYPCPYHVVEEELIEADQVHAVSVTGKVDWMALAGRWEALETRFNALVERTEKHFLS